jgi:predicted N-acyltransferase
VTTYSAHYIDDPGLRRAIDDFLSRERAYVRAAGEELAQAAPFRKGSSSVDDA